MLLDDNYGRDALFDRRAASDLLARPGRSSCRARGRCASSSRRTSAAGWSNGRSTTASRCCASIIRTIRPALKARADREAARRPIDAARKVGRELLIEIIAGKHGTLDDTTISRALDRALRRRAQARLVEARAAGVSRRAWAEIDRVIETRDPFCRGVVLLGLEAPQDELERGFRRDRRARRSVKGFAVGRTIFADAARAWLAGTMSDERGRSPTWRARFETADRGSWLRRGVSRNASPALSRTPPVRDGATARGERP